jgi:NAD(P)-dependent dehydrogenase (short-subunit alcohol dehydrogenase family)
MDLTGKVAIVTGAGSGMGRAGAVLFAGSGASVACADINAAAAEETVALIREAGGTAEAFSADVSKEADVADLVAGTEERFGGLDVLYNNAGLWLYGPDGYVVGETDGPSPLLEESIWDKTVNVTLKGTYLGCKYGIPALRRRGGGTIVNVSSTAAFRVGRGSSDAYTAAKGGVAAITRSLAVEHAADGIRVNCIVPGPIETPLVSRFSKEVRAKAVESIPMGRWGRPEEVAQMALFLASESSSYCTGQMFVVDGGYLAL